MVWVLVMGTGRREFRGKDGEPIQLMPQATVKDTPVLELPDDGTKPLATANRVRVLLSFMRLRA